ncbi:hypothetical protein E7740_00025 [Micrococcus luteus]
MAIRTPSSPPRPRPRRSAPRPRRLRPDLDPGAWTPSARSAAAERPVVLSGAGMSAESGIPTFRDAQTGLWSASPRNSSPRRRRSSPIPRSCVLVPGGVPGWCGPPTESGHDAVAAWQRRTPDLEVVTQNGTTCTSGRAPRAPHLHGSLSNTAAPSAGPGGRDPGRPSDVDAAGSEADLERCCGGAAGVPGRAGRDDPAGRGVVRRDAAAGPWERAYERWSAATWPSSSAPRA